jgi:hypothetical protein
MPMFVASFAARLCGRTFHSLRNAWSGRQAAVMACLWALPWYAVAGPLPIYQATATATSKKAVTNAGDLSASANNGVSYPSDGKGASVFVSASAAGLKVRANAGIPPQPMLTPFPPLSVNAGGTATMRFDDVVFSALDAGVSAGLIEVSLNLAIDGVFQLLQAGEGNATSRGGIAVSYGLGAPGVGSTATPQSVGVLSRRVERGISSGNNSGIFASLGSSDAWIVNDVFQTPSFLVPLDTPLLLTVAFNASAGAVSRDGSPADAITAFDQSLRFPLFGPVFNLAEGYTVNSAQAGIINNVSAVPLPPAAWLFSAGLLGLAIRLQGRRGAGAA